MMSSILVKLKRVFLWSFTPAHRLKTIFVVRDLLTNDFERGLLHAGKQPEHRANEGGLSVNCSLINHRLSFLDPPILFKLWQNRWQGTPGQVYLSIPGLHFLILFLNFLWHSLWLMVPAVGLTLWHQFYLFIWWKSGAALLSQTETTQIHFWLTGWPEICVCRQNFSSCLSVAILFIYSDEWPVSRSCGVDFRETLGTRTHWYLQHTHSTTHSPPYAAKKQPPSAWLMYACMFLHICEAVSVINRCNKRAKWKFLFWFVSTRAERNLTHVGSNSVCSVWGGEADDLSVTHLLHLYQKCKWWNPRLCVTENM